MKQTIFLITLLLTALTAFSQEKSLVFADGSAVEVNNATQAQRTANSVKPSPTIIIKLINKDFDAFLSGIGKAVPPLDERTLKRLSRNNKSLAAQIKQIHSAYELKQNDSKYYFSALNSVKPKDLDNCTKNNPCKVKIHAIIINFKDREKDENILIIRNIRKLE